MTSSLSTDNSRLVLGTVQLGMKYGVANKTGQPDENSARNIIKTSLDLGVNEFDTAQNYGESEKVLGQIITKLGIADYIKVVTKFHPKLDYLTKSILCEAIESSLENLCVPVLEGILLHQENLLDQWNDGLGSHLHALVKSGKVKRIGVSVYSVERATAALNIPGIDLIQLPSNLFDQRFERADFFAEAARHKKTIYIRSVFLQGLLLMASNKIPDFLSEAEVYLMRLSRLCEKYQLQPREIALGYIKSKMTEAKVVFGVDTVEQLNANIMSWGKSFPLSAVEEIRREFVDVPEKIINPTLWNN